MREDDGDVLVFYLIVLTSRALQTFCRVQTTKPFAPRAKFGFTFIICARENKAAAILTGLDNR